MSSELVLSELINDKKDIENKIHENIYNNNSDTHEILLKNNYKRLNIITEKIDNYFK